MRKILVPVSVLALLLATVGIVLAGSPKFGADLAGSTSASGKAMLAVKTDGTELAYELIVHDIQNVTQAHIHVVTPPNVNGPITVWLYPSPTARTIELIPGESNGMLAHGRIVDADVIGPLAGQGLAGLMAQIEAGNTYVNVHTQQNPAGEIRGTIVVEK